MGYLLFPWSSNRLVWLISLAVGFNCINTSQISNIDLEHSLIEAQPPIMFADGKTPTQVTFYAKQSQGAVVPNLSIEFVSENCQFQPASGFTDAKGEFSSQVTATIPGIRTIRTRIQIGQFQGSLTTQGKVTFIRSFEQQGIEAGTSIDYLLLLPPSSRQSAPGLNHQKISFRSSDPIAKLPEPVEWTDALPAYFMFPQGVALKTAGLQTVIAYEQESGRILNEQVFEVQPGPIHRLLVQSVPSIIRAGDTLSLQAEAIDNFGNPTQTQHSINVQSSDVRMPDQRIEYSQNTGPWLDVGNHQFLSTGTTILRFDDIQQNRILLEASFTIQPGNPASLTVEIPQTISAGQSFPVQAYWQDNFGNPCPFQHEPLIWSSSDMLTDFHLPTSSGDLPLYRILGQATFYQAGQQTIRLELPERVLSDISNPIHVVAGPTVGIDLISDEQAIAGHYTRLTAQSVDHYGNRTSQLFSLTVETSDEQAFISENNRTSVEQPGILSLTMILRTSGLQTITVTMSENQLLQASVPIWVLPNNMTGFLIDNLPTTLIAGTAQSMHVVAVDDYNNPVPDFTGELHLTSSDPLATLPDPVQLTQQHQGEIDIANVILRSAGQQTIGIYHQLHPEQDGLSQPIMVQATLPHHLNIAWISPSPITACHPIQIHTQAVDMYNNSVAWQGTTQIRLSQLSQPDVLLLGDIINESNPLGLTRFTDLKINHPGQYALQAINPTPYQALHASAPMVLEIAPHTPNISINTVEDHNNHLQITYNLRSACPVDIILSFDGQQTGSYTQAKSLPTSERHTGSYQIPGQSTLQQRRFVWDSSDPLTREQEQQIQLRLQAFDRVSNTSSTSQQQVTLPPIPPAILAATWPNLSSTQSFQPEQSLSVSRLGGKQAGMMNVLLSDPNGAIHRITWPSTAPITSQQPATLWRSATFPYQAQHLIQVDSNRDGWMDIVTLAPHQHQSSLFLGSHVGWQNPNSVPAILGTVAMDTQDFDRNGYQDMVYLADNGNGLMAWSRQVNGNYLAIGQLPLPSPILPLLRWIDANQDGRPDVVIPFPQGIYLLYQSGTGFVLGTTLPVPNPIESLEIADINRDGMEDIVVTSNHTIQIFLAAGPDLFHGQQPVALPSAVGRLAITDWDANGYQDLLVASTTQPAIYHLTFKQGQWIQRQTILLPNPVASFAFLDNVAQNQSHLLVALNNGSLQLLGNNTPRRPQWSLDAPEAFSVNHPADQILSADINQDGYLDAIVISQQLNLFSNYLASGAGQFTYISTLATLAQPNWGTLTDTDGDGYLDLILGSRQGPQWQTYRGTSQGFFIPEPIQPLPAASRQVLSADINRDGRSDLVFATEQGMALYLNPGDGTATTLTMIPTPQPVTSIYIADINQDGLHDLIFTLDHIHHVLTALGLGHGTFQAPMAFPLPCIKPIYVQSADLNQDSHLDILTQCDNGTLVWMYGDSTGQFAPPQQVAHTPSLRFSIVDLNRDGFPDILKTSGDKIIWMRNDGMGQWVESSLRSAESMRDINLHDYNQDGLLDFLTISQSTPGLLVLHPGHDLTLPMYGTTLSGPFQSFAVADMNHDSAIDIVALHPNHQWNVLKNNTLGQFVAQPHQPTIANAHYLELGDMNQDGFDDVFIASSINNQGHLFLNDQGSGMFSSPNVINDIRSDDVLHPIELLDFNRDGCLDIVSTNRPVAQSLRPVYVHTCMPGNTYSNRTQVGQRYAYFQWSDINFDSWPDIISTNSTNGGAYTLHNRNNGFETAYDSQWGFVGINNQNVVAGDFNNDQRLDVVHMMSSTYFVLYLANNQMVQPYDYKNAFYIDNSTYDNAHVADINGDGDMDVVLFSTLSSTAACFLGNGKGEFAHPRFFVVEPNIKDLRIVDIHQDGKSDVVVLTTDSLVVRKGL